VIAETIPGAYDSVGRQVTASYFHRKAPHRVDVRKWFRFWDHRTRSTWRL